MTIGQLGDVEINGDGVLNLNNDGTISGTGAAGMGTVSVNAGTMGTAEGQIRFTGASKLTVSIWSIELQCRRICVAGRQDARRYRRRKHLRHELYQHRRFRHRHTSGGRAGRRSTSTHLRSKLLGFWPTLDNHLLEFRRREHTATCRLPEPGAATVSISSAANLTDNGSCLSRATAVILRSRSTAARST